MVKWRVMQDTNMTYDTPPAPTTTGQEISQFPGRQQPIYIEPLKP